MIFVRLNGADESHTAFDARRRLASATGRAMGRESRASETRRRGARSGSPGTQELRRVHTLTPPLSAIAAPR